ncbi:hypothetical protein C4K18_2003 [Pseudomonas chlororaphis subsp. aurantiaca]|nr:hypothetical protein C4K18_2003 [Pseudomonas chlororaphis subsp. aurantiaca]
MWAALANPMPTRLNPAFLPPHRYPIENPHETRRPASRPRRTGPLPRPQKREKNLVLQIALGVFFGGLALWLVQLAATSLAAKFMLGTFTFGG